jgi:L-threonylcarbamoyladenylate synthase
METIAGTITRFDGAVSADSNQIAPGMTKRHYAPKARLIVFELDELAALIGLAHQAQEKTVVVILGDEVIKPNYDYRHLPDDPRGVSARLYAILHDLDAQGYQRILFQAPPQTEEWMAVSDRLRRAASWE